MSGGKTLFCVESVLDLRALSNSHHSAKAGIQSHGITVVYLCGGGKGESVSISPQVFEVSVFIGGS